VNTYPLAELGAAALVAPTHTADYFRIKTYATCESIYRPHYVIDKLGVPCGCGRT